MDIFAVILFVAIPIWTWFVFFKSSSKKRKGAKLPPGPPRFPIVGNMFQLGQSPHISLARLSKTYGPLMSLQLGNVYTVVVTSPENAKEVLKTQDKIFSSRRISQAAHGQDHYKRSVGYLPVGDAWRKLRKICKEQMFTTLRLEDSQWLRQEKLSKMLDYLHGCSAKGRAVCMNEVAFVTTFNLMSATLFSTELAKFESDETGEFRELVEGVAKIVGVPNFADYFPILQPFDPQGIKKLAGELFGKILDLIGNILDERLEERAKSPNSPRKTDLMETLIDLTQGSEYDLTIEDVKHLLMDLFVGGADTMTSTIEWAMVELILHKDKLAKAKQELRAVIGDKTTVEESDISKLPYFQALVKEVLRYHPPGPLLIPHKSDEDAVVRGYLIPKDTQILVNVWAMGRNPDLWSNPHSFEPERFLNVKTDFKGQNFELIPFGGGRRMCPALPLANRMLHITIGTLIHNFDWKFEEGMTPEKMDMTEKFGLSLRKAIPLMAVPFN